MAIDNRTASGKLIKTLLDNGPSHDYTGESLHEIKQRIRNSATTRRRTYLTLNPELITPEVYDKKSVVMEHHRTAFSRLWLASHRLRIETGRWSRIPPEQRLCDCGEVQTETHALFHCPTSDNVRQTYNIDSNENFHTILKSRDTHDICAFCYEILNLFAL